MNVINLSGGISSILSAYYFLQEDSDAKVVYIDTNAHHPDMAGYIDYVENDILKHEVLRLKSPYKDHFEVIGLFRHTKRCRTHLKIRVREKFEYENPGIKQYIWGFDKKEVGRLKSIKKNNPSFSHQSPLIDHNLTKEKVHEEYFRLFPNAKYPTMYAMGYNNNNCIGCPEGGLGYWKAIKIDFPETFDRAIECEKKLKRKESDWLRKGEFFTFNQVMKKGIYYNVPLTEIHKYKGRPNRHILSNCGIACYGMKDT